jgi:glucose-1-phosphate thymidylyltransferase
MDAIILAGGYATRLQPLTLNVSKPLLPVAGYAIIDHVLDRLEEVEEVDRAYVVTNEKFYSSYLDWLKNQNRRFAVIPVNDGTTDNENRLGAVGDIRYAIEFGAIGDDVIIIGGDNLFDFDLRTFVRFQREHDRPALGCYDVGRRELVSLYSEVRLEGDRVVAFVEKPAEPSGTLIGILCYIFRSGDFDLLTRYLDDGNDADKAGSFIQWLVSRTEVVGYGFGGRWIDIGTKEELDRAEVAWRNPE